MTTPPCAHVDRRLAGPPVTRLWIIFGLTALFMLVEVVGGWLSGSLALLADAGHMLTDVGAIGLTLLTAWIARRPADQSKTYGYLRWEILAALVNGALLFGIAAMVVYEAIARISHPEPIKGGLFLAVALAGLVVNGISLWLLHGQHEHHHNTRGAYLHILGDLLGSAGAVVAAAIVTLHRLDPGRPDHLGGPVAADSGGGLAAGPGEHRHPAGRGPFPYRAGRGRTADAGHSRRPRGA